jgi:hypothetical protein
LPRRRRDRAPGGSVDREETTTGSSRATANQRAPATGFVPSLDRRYEADRLLRQTPQHASERRRHSTDVRLLRERTTGASDAIQTLGVKGYDGLAVAS